MAGRVRRVQRVQIRVHTFISLSITGSQDARWKQIVLWKTNICRWNVVLVTFPPVSKTSRHQHSRCSSLGGGFMVRSRRRWRTPRLRRRHRRKASPPRRCPLAACGNENEGVLIKQKCPCLQVGSTKRALGGHSWMTSAQVGLAEEQRKIMFHQPIAGRLAHLIKYNWACGIKILNIVLTSY